jgi:hypothetical protein
MPIPGSRTTYKYSAETEASMANVNQVIPVIVYADIPRAHDFLVEVFGFQAGGVQYDGSGRPCTVK